MRRRGYADDDALRGVHHGEGVNDAEERRLYELGAVKQKGVCTCGEKNDEEEARAPHIAVGAENGAGAR